MSGRRKISHIKLNKGQVASRLKSPQDRKCRNQATTLDDKNCRRYIGKARRVQRVAVSEKRNRQKIGRTKREKGQKQHGNHNAST